MKFSKNSWINKLNKEYAKATLDKHDKANEIILDALASLERLNKAPTVENYEKQVKALTY